MIRLTQHQFRLTFTLLLILSSSVSAFAQTEDTSLLTDSNGDGAVTIVGFGDSITRGDGDFTSPGERIFQAETPSGEAGYPLRVEQLLHISVSNKGDPGDAWVGDGLERFIGVAYKTHSDIIVIGNGSNDARRFTNPTDLYYRVQTAINVARANGTTPILLTIIPTCCGHAFIQGGIDTYNPRIRLLAAVNELRLADADLAFRNTCEVTNCKLLSRPEGLHPNEDGYDVMGEVVISTLLGIDLFAPDGPTLLAQALGVDPSQIKTVPSLPTETPQE